MEFLRFFSQRNAFEGSLPCLQENSECLAKLNCDLSGKIQKKFIFNSRKPSHCLKYWQGKHLELQLPRNLLIKHRSHRKWCMATCTRTRPSLSVSCCSLSSHSFSLLLFSSAWAACCLCRDASSCRCFSRLRCFSCSISELGRELWRDKDVQEEERSLRACRWSSMKLSCWTTTAWVDTTRAAGQTDETH